MTAPPSIEFRNVEVAYNRYVKALNKVSFEIQKGEFVFLLGPTGSGKSTILKLLYRDLKASEGQVILDGQDLGQIPDQEVYLLRRKLGVVPQDFGLLEKKKAWEQIGYAMRAVGRTKSEVRRSVESILDRVKMAHRADAFPNELSGGEQQRLAIARALISNPELILADEPTGNLDPENSQGIMSVLTELNQAGVTVLVATHDMMVVEQFPARIIRLSKGEIESDTGVPAHA